MALTAANVDVAVTGGVFYAPAGTALPTDATTTKNVAFVELGYVDEDGVTETIDDSSNNITAWQNAVVVRTVFTATAVTYTFNIIETNAVSLASYYGNYAAGVVHVMGAASNRRGEWIFESVDGSKKRRVVVPDGMVTQRGDVQWVNSDTISYPIRVTCYPDSGGDFSRIYLNPSPT